MIAGRGLGVSTTLAAALALACTPASPPRAALAANESWCPEGFEIGPQDTCFAVPESHGKDTPVLVYLHGMYSGHGSAEEWSLVRSATAKGFAVVVPRGKRGLCAWKAELANHFCWPHEPEDPESFRSIVKEWDRVLWQVEAILEGGTHKRYVLGFSNGAYFAEHLAVSGYFPASAYAFVNGGLLAPVPQAKGRPTPPLLLVAAQEDADHGPAMKEMHEALTGSTWPHAFCTRPGTHFLTAADVDAALAFFRKEASGALRPQGTSYTCDARP